MAQPAPTTVTCPNCGQPYNALLEQILDVNQDPTAKQRLLGGQVNNVTCPNCGFNSMVGTPLLYHDPAKELLLVYVPMELGLDHVGQEKLIGELTNQVMNSIPDEQRKAYLLQPKPSLSMQGLMDQVLEADGITKEVIEEQQRKVDFVQELADATPSEQDSLIEENMELLDMTFFDALNLLASAATQEQRERDALRLLNLRSKLMDVTEAGQILKAREAALAEANNELKALGEAVTREAFVDLLVAAADNSHKVEALASLGRQLIDYSTFQLLTERIDAAEGETKEQLTAVRETLLQISAMLEQQSRAIAQQAADTLSAIMTAPDIKQAIMQHSPRIDDNFMAVLQINIDEASRSGNVEASARLKIIRDEVLALIQESAPPEVKFINELLSANDDATALDILHERKDELNEDLLVIMEQLTEQLRQGGNQPAADRLDILREEAVSIVL